MKPADLGGWRGANQTRGLLLALVTAMVSGVSIFVNAYAVSEFPSPTAFTALKNTLVVLFLLPLLLRPLSWSEVRELSWPRALCLVLIGIIGGSVPFVLFFEGLAQVSSAGSAFIHKTMFVWVAGLAMVFLRERLHAGHLVALGLLALAQVLLNAGGLPSSLGVGELMLLGATLLWSVEVILVKRTLSWASPGLLVMSRMGIGAVVLLGFLAVSGRLSLLIGLSSRQWLWAAGTALLLALYVLSWFSALKAAPATAVTCVLTLGAPITALLALLAGRPAPSSEELIGHAVLMAGVAVTMLVWRRTSADATAARLASQRVRV